MTTLNITLAMDNDAFAEYPRTEVSRILRHLASVVEASGLPDYARPILDANGNQCGMMLYEDDL